MHFQLGSSSHHSGLYCWRNNLRVRVEGLGFRVYLVYEGNQANPILQLVRAGLAHVKSCSEAAQRSNHKSHPAEPHGEVNQLFKALNKRRGGL